MSRELTLFCSLKPSSICTTLGILENKKDFISKHCFTCGVASLTQYYSDRYDSDRYDSDLYDSDRYDSDRNLL